MTTHYTKSGAWYTCAYCQKRSQGERPARTHLERQHGEKLIDERIMSAEQSVKYHEGELATYLTANALVADLAAGRISVAPEQRSIAQTAFEDFARGHEPSRYKWGNKPDITPEAYLRSEVAEAKERLAELVNK